MKVYSLKDTLGTKNSRQGDKGVKETEIKRQAGYFPNKLGSYTVRLATKAQHILNHCLRKI